MKMNLYPTTSGRLSIKENRKSIVGYDAKTKKWIELNKSLENLLLLCDGKNNIEDVVGHISSLYRISKEEARDKIIKTLEQLEKDEIIEFNTNPTPESIRLRKYNFEWPLQAVFIEVTNRCNLQCKHCYNYSSPIQSFGLEKQVLFSFLDQIDELGAFHVYFTGGEPFYREDFDEILEYSYNKGLDIGILTNGTLLTQRGIRLLEKINPKFVAISLDSIDENKYRKIRGISNRKVIENIVNLKESGIRVRINIVLFKNLNDSYEDLTNLLKFLKDIGLTEKDIAIDEFLEVGRGCAHSEYILDKKRTIQNIKKAFQEVFNFDYSVRPTYVSGKVPSQLSFCGLGESIFYLNSKGDITLCTILNGKDFKAGSIFEQSVKDIWENSDLFWYFRNKKHIKNSKCEKCTYLKECAGGCKAKPALLEGSFNKPDYWMCAFLEKIKVS